MDDADRVSRPVDWAPTNQQVGGVEGGGARGAPHLAEFARLREQCPVAWAEEWGGYFTLTRYDDIVDAIRREEALRVGRAFIQIPDFSEVSPIIPIGIGPPDHTVYRRVLNRYFSPQRMAAIEPDFRRKVTVRLHDIVGQGGVDVVHDLCGPVAAEALALVLHLPDSYVDELLEQLAESESLRAAVANGERAEDTDFNPNRPFEILAAGVRTVVAERRENPLDPDEDVLTGALDIEIDGQKIDDLAITGIGVALFGAGHQTTRDGMGSALYFLATNPGDQTRLRRRPELIGSAVEEYLRLDPPTQENVRRASEDVSISGTLVSHGDYVALSFAAANRDEAHFEHPDACIIERSPNPHLSFGHGRHKCLGAPLARMEIRVLLEETLRATKSIEPAGAPMPGPAIQFGGFQTLPLRFVPA